MDDNHEAPEDHGLENEDYAGSMKTGFAAIIVGALALHGLFESAQAARLPHNASAPGGNSHSPPNNWLQFSLQHAKVASSIPALATVLFAVQNFYVATHNEMSYMHIH